MLGSRFGRVLQHARGYSLGNILQFILHLPNFIRLSFRLLGDPRVPLQLKLICYAALAYLVFPIDIIKDMAVVLGGLGLVDDVVILFFAFRNLITNSPPEVVQQHVEDIAGKTPPPPENDSQENTGE